MLSFYKDKSVFVTGHTGFKGSWLTLLLCRAGAHVTGYSLEPDGQQNLFSMLNFGSSLHSVTGDIRDADRLWRAFEQAKPDLVFHLAAQPIVRESYQRPAYTYETNVMGTVNILECVRRDGHVKSFLNVTTDKVYHNNEWAWGYRECDPLDGYDPYSNSKSCSELVTHSYRSSFFSDGHTAISTARAGNVIGGGDFATDRIIPDCIRAAMLQKPIVVRNPYSTRPYQHVLEPLMAYLLIASEQAEHGELAGYYNVGPDDCDCLTTGELVTLFTDAWGENLTWKNGAEPNAPHEANFLKLDCSKLKTALGWKPTWHIAQAIEKTVEWTKAYRDGQEMTGIMARQIDEFCKAREQA